MSEVTIGSDLFYRLMEGNPYCPINDTREDFDSMIIRDVEFLCKRWEIHQEDINIHNALRILDAKADAEADTVDDRDL